MPPLGARLGELHRLIEDTIARRALATGAPRGVLVDDDLADITTRITGQGKRGRRKIDDWNDLEEYVSRLLALRQGGGINQAEKILGMAHGALSKWASKWSPPPRRG